MAQRRGAVSPRRIKATPELFADIRDRYEHTPESVATMAADLGCCTQTVDNIAKREGWVRYVAPPRDLSPAARLRARAETLSQQGTASLSLPPCGGGLGRGVAVGEETPRDSTTTPTPDPSPQGGGENKKEGGGEEREIGGEKAPASEPADTADLHATIAEQMLREVAGLLDDVRAERKRMKREGYAKHELQAVSRVIADLSASLNRLKPMAQRAAEPDTGTAYDDMPADLDEFREALARRIEAFFESRPDEGDAGAASTDDTPAPQS